MALDSLADKVREDAKREVAQIMDEAEKKASAIEAEARTRCDSLARREIEAVRTKLKYATMREQSSRELEARHSFLNERELHLQELVRRFSKWLNGLPPAQEAKLLGSMMDKALQQVKTGVIIAAPRAKDLLGKEEGFAFQADENIGGGFKLMSADGRKVIDMTYDSVVAEFWERQRCSAARDLFGDGMAMGSTGE